MESPITGRYGSFTELARDDRQFEDARAYALAAQPEHQLRPWDGVVRDSPAVSFAKNNAVLYDSAIAGISYGAAKILGASERTAYGFALLGASVDALGGGITGGGFLRSVSVRPASVADLDPAISNAGTVGRAYLNDKFGRTGDINIDINIRGRQETATNFFLSQGVPSGKIPSYMTGIDFSQPVDRQAFNSGKPLWQYQTSGAPQGNWYTFSPTTTPTELGISPFGFNRASNTVESKNLNSYITGNPVVMLRSTSASVNDFWSVKGQSYPTTGGARQLFSTQDSAFLPRPTK